MSPTDTPNGPAPNTTAVPAPRRRVFLKQSLRERIGGILWTLVRATLFRASPPVLNPLRIAILRLFGARIERGVYVAPSCHIDFPWNLRIGHGAYLCHCTIVNCMGTIDIGPESRISQYAHLCAGTHDYQRADMAIIRCPITIGRRVWIAADAFVGPGVNIGDEVMLAARSATFSDLPAGFICVGEPAVPRKPRFAHQPSPPAATATAAG